MAKAKKKRTKKATLLSKHIAGRSSNNIKKDRKRRAKKPGVRRSKSGKKYSETRPNRSDIEPKNKF